MDRVENTKSRVLTVRELADHLHVHASTVYRLLKNRQLPGFRVGTDWRFSVQAINQWLAELEAAGLAPASRVHSGTRK